MTFDKLVAQTYDGASNMSGCYNGLQAIIREKVGDHVIYVHCQAHILNLVLSDSACVDISVINLFSQLEKLYIFFSKSQKVSSLFKEVQRGKSLKVWSIKRLNTVRWSSRELCLKVLLHRYESIIETLSQISESCVFDEHQRAIANGLLSAFSTKQTILTACLFREVFAVTGPLSRYLQSENVDFGKALNLVDACIEKLTQLRNASEDIVAVLDKDFKGLEWRKTRTRKRKLMCDEHTEDTIFETPVEKWKVETFFKVLDTIIFSLRQRFSKNRPLLKSMDLFSPSNFDQISKRSCNQIEESISGFCTTYGIDQHSCADELLSFSVAFNKLYKILDKKDDGKHKEIYENYGKFSFPIMMNYSIKLFHIYNLYRYQYFYRI